MPNASTGAIISDSGQIGDGVIVNADINATANIAATKLATIATAGKVDGAALTLLTNIPAGAGVVPAANLPAIVYSLLKEASGTSTTTTANNLDTVAISGLTANDTIKVIGTASAITAAGGVTFLRQETDVVIIGNTNVTTASGGSTIFEFTLRQEQQAATAVYSKCEVGNVTTQGDADVAGTINIRYGLAWTTAWTGAWTLALRNTGVTAGGTLRWSWSVYKIAG